MNHTILFGFICALFLVSLTGVCLGKKSPAQEVYVQGGESTITDGANGSRIITVQDIVPYFYATEGNTSTLVPVEYLPDITGPSKGSTDPLRS